MYASNYALFSLVPSLVRGVSGTFAIQTAGVAVAYASQVLLARWMGVVDYGEYIYVLSWATLLAVPAGFGLNIAVLRFIPEYKTRKELSSLHGVVRWSQQLTLCAGVAFALLGYAAAAWFAAPEYTAALMLGVCLVPLLALMNLYTGMSRALYRVVVAFAPPLVARPLLLIIGSFVLLLALGQPNSQQVLGVSLIAGLIIVLYQWSAFRSDLSPTVGDAKPEYRYREWLHVASPLLLSVGCDVLLIQTGVLMVGTLSGPGEAGVYNAALKTALLLQLFLIAVNTFVAPQFASLHSQGKQGELQRLLVMAAHVMFWPSLVLGAMLLASSGFLLGLFGEEFVSARTPMAVLITGLLVTSGVGAVGRLTDLTGYQRQGGWIRGYSALFCIILSVILIPAYGALGAAIATTGGLILMHLWLSRLATKNLGVRPSIVFALARFIHHTTRI